MKKPCVVCETNPRWGDKRLCSMCYKAGRDEYGERPDLIPMPVDMDARVTALAQKVDPLASPLQCGCGLPTIIVGRYVRSLWETRFFEVCPLGHETAMRRHGIHRYDQHERAQKERERQDAITERALSTKRGNGTVHRRNLPRLETRSME